MSQRRSKPNPDEPLPLLQLIEQYREGKKPQLEKIGALSPPVPVDPGTDPEAELHAEIKTACVRAIRGSGMSRYEVVDEINRMFPRRDAPLPGLEPRDRTTIHMLNNYLALSKIDSRIPVSILLGICLTCDDFSPLEVLTARGSRHIITDRELVEQRLGALDLMQREVTQEKARTRQLLERVTTRRERPPSDDAK
jgi:hypothetical protein